MSNNTHVVKSLRTAIRSSLNMAGNTNAAVRQDRFEARLDNQGQDGAVDHVVLVTDHFIPSEKDPMRERVREDARDVARAMLEKYGIKQWKEEDFADPAHVAGQVLLAKAIVEQAGDAPGQEAMRKEVLEATTKLGQACPELVFSTFKGAVKASSYPAIDAEWMDAARMAAERKVVESLRIGVVNPDLEAKAESLAEREASAIATATVAGVIARAFAWKYPKDILALIQSTVLDIVGYRYAKRCASGAPKELADQAWKDAMGRWKADLGVFAVQVTAALNRRALPKGKLIVTSPDGALFAVQSTEEVEAVVLDTVGRIPGVLGTAAKWSKSRAKLQVVVTWDKVDEFTEENEVTTSVWGVTEHPGSSTTMKGCYIVRQDGTKIVAGIVECPVEDLDVAAAVAKASVDAVKAGPDRSFEVGGVTYTVFDL